MECPNCHAMNETGARFCGDCGATLAITRVAPSITAQPQPQFYCQRCGTTNPAGSKFCEACGASVNPAGVSMTNSRTGDTTGSKAGKPSGAWWLLPVLFGVVGGIFAWTAIKGKDSELAWRMFALGLLITVFVISFIISNDGFPSFSDFSFE